MLASSRSRGAGTRARSRCTSTQPRPACSRRRPSWWPAFSISARLTIESSHSILSPGTNGGRMIPRRMWRGKCPTARASCVAVWRDARTRALRVLLNSRDRLIELDAQSGQLVPEFGDHGIVNLLDGLQWPVDPTRYTNTSPPIVFGDLVIVGNGVADRLIYRRDPPGDVRAYDARTGRRVWSFHTVPHDGETGSETWSNGANRYTGHTNVWAPMTLDERRGLLYLPVSTPSNDFYGGNRLGANVFADSLVCLDAKSGVRRWHRQLVHHGLWDYDMPAPPSLVTLQHGGRRVDAVVQLT